MKKSNVEMTSVELNSILGDLVRACEVKINEDDLHGSKEEINNLLASSRQIIDISNSVYRAEKAMALFGKENMVTSDKLMRK